jgi:hypothetical protein
MRGRRGLLLLVVVAGAVAFFVLRGGDDGGRQVSHAELVREVNEICEELVAAGRALDPPFRPYRAEAESYFSDFLDRVEDAKGRLQDLRPPAADEAAYGSLVDGYTSIETDLEEAQGAAATDQDPEVIARINEIEATTKPMVEAEKALGACQGATSVAALPGLLRRTVPNPLSETGEL